MFNEYGTIGGRGGVTGARLSEKRTGGRATGGTGRFPGVEPPVSPETAPNRPKNGGAVTPEGISDEKSRSGHAGSADSGLMLRYSFGLGVSAVRWASTKRAADRISASPRGLPKSCSPIGRPAPFVPAGTDMPGMPARLAVTV